MSYSTCNYTTEIDENECIGDSLTTINANFSSLEVPLCTAVSDIANLKTLINTLSSSLYYPGTILQTKYSVNKNTASTSDVAGSSNTAPTTSSGVEILSATITPRFSNSAIKITGIAQTSDQGGGSGNVVLGLFKDSNTSAIATVTWDSASNAANHNPSLIYYDTVTSITPVTYKIRMYCERGTGTIILNRNKGIYTLGGTIGSYITIEEIKI